MWRFKRLLFESKRYPKQTIQRTDSSSVLVSHKVFMMFRWYFFITNQNRNNQLIASQLLHLKWLAKIMREPQTYCPFRHLKLLLCSIDDRKVHVIKLTIEPHNEPITHVGSPQSHARSILPLLASSPPQHTQADWLSSSKSTPIGFHLPSGAAPGRPSAQISFDSLRTCIH